MTMRFDEDDIVKYLLNFNKNHIIPTNHSKMRNRQRNFSLNELIEIIKTEKPIYIQQQEFKKFSLIYEYENEKIKRVIVIKDKFINIATAHRIGKKYRGGLFHEKYEIRS
ncbi:hypothetical protein ALNOE001_07530 [Candidatus Methanobinarius endosymbioticus]|uniref:Uncharacterized protein n=1 Tax=Candidatus Methanobinarius endosymbioticus TaxID=2006182 RepID=A0A366MBR5_9EURY|nr:hypothetical protein ALNOE001_07530 [Candidatus Methanobinarius endosymbioticus]